MSSPPAILPLEPTAGTAAPRARLRRAPRWTWPSLAVFAVALPFLPALVTGRVFYIRDLSLFFWGRYIWLRRTLVAGHWPLWDPYVGYGQAAVADGLHQMFHVPALILRLTGSEVVGFDLWVAVPFPLAALGAWLFLKRRFSAPASTLGAIAFVLSGPIISTANFPNMSWSVATLPWVLWSVDRIAAAPSRRAVAVLSIAVALQALAGEPVTLFTTMVLAAAYAFFAPGEARPTFARSLKQFALVVAGTTVGLLLAALQLVPMTLAVPGSHRTNAADAIFRDLWSLHPLAMLETVSLHLFGDYYTVQSLRSVPWMPVVHGGREPFFFSLYFGVPLLALTAFGLAARFGRRWALFWAAAGAVAFIFGAGIYTPVYPFIRNYVPVLHSFRFPIKYLIVVSVAIAAVAAAGWDALAHREPARGHADDGNRARIDAVAVPLVVAVTTLVLGGICVCFPGASWSRLRSIAVGVGSGLPSEAADYAMQHAVAVAAPIVVMSALAAVLLFVATGTWRRAPLARVALYLLIVGDLLVAAWNINPAFDPAYLGEPQWIARTKAGGDRDAGIYVGGKQDGTLDATDYDSARAFLNAPGLRGSASRAALGAEAAFYPSAWHTREIISYDLAMLWPEIYDVMVKRFQAAAPDERARFLDRTGVRWRIYPSYRVAGLQPVMAIPLFLRSSLYDFKSPKMAPRAGIVSQARIVADVRQQVEGLFQDGWDARTTVLIERQPAAAGISGRPVGRYATIRDESPTRVIVEAGIDTRDAYMVLLDSYSDDWRVTVDGTPAPMVRANGLFRAVRLTSGRHVLEFDYRPRAFQWGLAISAAAAVLLLILIAPRRTSAARPT